jgi:hypothetical protein
MYKATVPSISYLMSANWCEKLLCQRETQEKWVVIVVKNVTLGIFFYLSLVTENF